MILLTPSQYYEQADKGDRYIRQVFGPFEEGLSSGERKRLRKLEGYRVERSSLSVCYPIILDNRNRKGRDYSMTLESWESLATLPDTVFCFVMEGLAAALCVRVSPDTLYVQAWGDVEGQEKLSPVVGLCKGIYHWCSENEFNWLDIGIAGDNAGLAAFKERLGFRLGK